MKKSETKHTEVMTKEEHSELHSFRVNPGRISRRLPLSSTLRSVKVFVKLECPYCETVHSLVFPVIHFKRMLGHFDCDCKKVFFIKSFYKVNADMFATIVKEEDWDGEIIDTIEHRAPTSLSPTPTPIKTDRVLEGLETKKVSKPTPTPSYEVNGKLIPISYDLVLHLRREGKWGEAKDVLRAFRDNCDRQKIIEFKEERSKDARKDRMRSKNKGICTSLSCNNKAIEGQALCKKHRDEKLRWTRKRKREKQCQKAVSVSELEEEKS